MKEAGFRYEPGDGGNSSGGSFASAAFRRGDLEIGLIVRGQGELGCPNYSRGKGYAGHEDVFGALGHEGEERLVLSGFISYADRDGGVLSTRSWTTSRQ